MVNPKCLSQFSERQVSGRLGSVLDSQGGTTLSCYDKRAGWFIVHAESNAVPPETAGGLRIPSDNRLFRTPPPPHKNVVKYNSNNSRVYCRTPPINKQPRHSANDNNTNSPNGQKRLAEWLLSTNVTIISLADRYHSWRGKTVPTEVLCVVSCIKCPTIV